MRTTPLLATAWAGAATAAVGLGFFAVGLLDADPVPASAATTLTPSSSAAATTSATPSSSAPDSTAALTGQYVTDGGTVYGSCIDGALQLASAPAAGWEVDDSSTATAVELKGGDRRIHVTATCGPAGPVFTVATGGDGDGTDDSSGRGSGGRGSDDSGSDDHGSGGHGSDD